MTKVVMKSAKITSAPWLKRKVRESIKERREEEKQSKTEAASSKAGQSVDFKALNVKWDKKKEA